MIYISDESPQDGPIVFRRWAHNFQAHSSQVLGVERIEQRTCTSCTEPVEVVSSGRKEAEGVRVDPSAALTRPLSTATSARPTSTPACTTLARRSAGNPS